MALFYDGIPHCKRCRAELEGGETVCPDCDFDPKQAGLRITGLAFAAVVVLMTASILAVLVVPPVGLLFMILAGAAFALSFVTFVTAMMATPYRFGALYRRF